MLTKASARMECRRSGSSGMFAESSLTAVDPKVVALAERAAGFDCKTVNPGPVVVSTVVGPGIETPGDVSSGGMLPLIAESTLR